MNRFNRKEKTFTHFRAGKSPGMLANDEIWNLYEDRAGNLWVTHFTSDRVGLERFDREKGVFTHYAHNPLINNTVSSSGISGIYEDEKTGILWVLNKNGVIDKHDKRNQRFRLWQHDPNNPNSLRDNEVLPIYEDSHGSIWIGTKNGGLSRLDRKRGLFRNYLPDPNDPTSIPSVNVNIVYEDSTGSFWIGSWGGTLCLFDRAAEKCEKIYRNDPNDPTSIAKSQWMQSIVEDSNDPNILWLGSFHGGLDRFDKKGETFTHFKHDPKDPTSLSSNIITTTLDEGDGKIWLTTYGGGLNQFDKKTGRFKHYKHDPNDPRSINSNALYEVFRDASGTLWVGGKGGLSRFDSERGQFKNYTKATGFPSNIIDSFLEDNQGNLWLGTIDTGIIKFNPKDETFQVFTKDDGIASNAIFVLSSLKSRDGTFWFGGSKGVTSFHPDDIVKNSYVPPIVLTSLKQGGKEMDTGMAPEKIHEVVLQWPNNYFEFQFAALSHTSPHENNFAYMLEGRDVNWYYSGTNPFGRYTGLSGGTYTLRLKGSNNDGVWNEKGRAIKIKVIPPFWERWWFYALLVIAGILIIIFVLYYLTKLKYEISERKLTEKELQDSQEQYEKLVQLSPNLVLTYSRAGIIEFINDSGIKLLGGSIPPDIIGTPISQFIPQKKRENFNWFTKNLFKTFEPLTIEEELLVKMDGEPIYVYVSAIPFTLRSKPSILLIAQDISERKKSEEEKALLESQLRQAQKMEAIGTLAGGIAHDFNNILQGIFMSIQLIQNKIPKESPAKKFLDRAFIFSVRGAELVKQILTFSRRSEQEISIMQVTPVIKEVLKMMRSLLPSNIEMRKSLPENCGNIQGSLTQIHQVIMNLCTNAGYSMREAGGVLEVTLENFLLQEPNTRQPELEQGEYLKLTIRDTGTGMSKEVQEHIFEPFFTTKPKGEGTGLGLSVVHGILMDHKGAIAVESELGKGTTFEILLPVIQDKTRVSEESKQIGIGGNERILLVDDEKLIAEVEKEVLEELGYRVTITNDGEAALKLYRSSPDQFDLILTDQTMPGMTGDQFAKLVLNEFPDVPVILMTGYSYLINREKMKNIGVREFIIKPFDGERIGSLIRRIMDNKP